MKKLVLGKASCLHIIEQQNYYSQSRILEEFMLYYSTSYNVQASSSYNLNSR